MRKKSVEINSMAKNSKLLILECFSDMAAYGGEGESESQAEGEVESQV